MPRGYRHLIDDTWFLIEDCPTCGIQYLLPYSLAQEAKRVRDRHNDVARPDKSQVVTIHCPRGHGWHYTTKAEEASGRNKDAPSKNEEAPAPPVDSDVISAIVEAKG